LSTLGTLLSNTPKTSLNLLPVPCGTSPYLSSFTFILSMNSLKSHPFSRVKIRDFPNWERKDRSTVI